MGSEGKYAMHDKEDKKSKKIKRNKCSDFELLRKTDNVLHMIDEASVELRKIKNKRKKEKRKALEIEFDKEKDSFATEADNEKGKRKCQKTRRVDCQNNEEVSTKKHKKSRVAMKKSVAMGAGNEKAAEAKCPKKRKVEPQNHEEFHRKKHKKNRVGEDNFNGGGEAIEVIQASTQKVRRKKHKKTRVDKDNCNGGGEATEVTQASNEMLVIGREKNVMLQINIGKDASNNNELKAAENSKRKQKKNNKNKDKFEEVSPQEGLQKNIQVRKDKGDGDFEHSKAEEASERKKVKEGSKEEEKKEVKKQKSDEEVADASVVKGNTGEKESEKVKMLRSKIGLAELPVETEVGGTIKTMIAKPMENSLKGVSETKTSGRSTDCSNKSKRKGKPKRVRFSEDLDVLVGQKFVEGKPYSGQEDEILRTTVFSYIEEHALGKDGLDTIMHCKNYPELKDCWKHIAKALPKRPRESIYYRAQMLFEWRENCGSTEMDIELIRNHYRELRSNRKRLADLGKHKIHKKDTWRRIKLPNMKRGHWSHDEYQNLFDFVNMDLQRKALEGKKSKHGMLRDNICWGAISDKLATRTDSGCCVKWYAQLTSPMVEEGLWDDADDYRLLNALYNLDASCIEDVEWDSLFEHRPGDVCRKRWGQMVNHIGEHEGKSFSELVEVLSKRYCPELFETRGL